MTPETSAQRRRKRAGRWGPAAFYGLIVLSWLADGIASDTPDLWLLVLWTAPPLALYLWRTR